METEPPGRSTGREIAERVAEAALGSVPLVGNALAVTFVTALGWRLEQRRETWFTELAEAVEELRQRTGAPDLEALTGDDRFTDAVVSATRTVEHTQQAEKIEALRNAVLNSVAPGAPDADTQAIIMNLIDRFTPTHLRLLALWDNPPAWFASRGIPQPQGAFATSRTVTIEAGLPELQGRKGLLHAYRERAHSRGPDGRGKPRYIGYPSGPVEPTDNRLRQAVRQVHQPSPGQLKGSTGGSEQD